MTFVAWLTVVAMAVRREPWSLRSTRTIAVALIAFVAVVMTPAIVGGVARSLGTQTTLVAIVVATLVGVAVLLAPWNGRGSSRPEQTDR